MSPLEAGVGKRNAGYRLIYMAEVQPLCDLLSERETPLARELCDALEREWRQAYGKRTPRTAFAFYPPPAAMGLLAELLLEVRQGGPV